MRSQSSIVANQAERYKVSSRGHWGERWEGRIIVSTGVSPWSRGFGRKPSSCSLTSKVMADRRGGVVRDACVHEVGVERTREALLPFGSKGTRGRDAAAPLVLRGHLLRGLAWRSGTLLCCCPGDGVVFVSSGHALVLVRARMCSW